MSTTSLAVALNVREVLGDPDTGRPVFGNAAMRQAVNRHMTIVSRELGLGTAWGSAAVTLLTNTLDYTLSGTAEYQQVRQVVFTSDMANLPIRSFEEVMDRRAGNVGTGRPSMCCLRPTSTQTTVLMVDSYPATSETLDLLYSTLPETWDASDATAPTIPFSAPAARALELRVAASLAASAGAEKRNALALGAADVETWLKEAAELIRTERLTIIRMKRSRAVRGGWFSAWSAQ